MKCMHMISRDRDHSGMTTRAFVKVFLVLIFLNTIFEEKKHTLNPDFTLFVSITCSKSPV